MTTRLLIVLLGYSLVVLTACSSAVRTSAGHYGPTPGAQKIDGSRGQTVRSFIAKHDAQDVREAATKAAGFDGLGFDVVTDKMLSGAGQWVPPGHAAGCTPNQLYAIYLNQTGKRQTNVTVVVDHMGICGFGSDYSVLLAQRLVSNMNRVLATFE